jgi:hypothetical protein
MSAIKIEEAEPTWVTVEDAARFAGVSRSTVTRLCAARGIPVQEKGKRRHVPLERVLAATTGKDLEAFRQRLTKAAALVDAPAAVREWAEALLGMVEPLIERAVVAEQRAALAEAKLALLEKASGSSG